MTLPCPGIKSPWIIAHRGDMVHYPENTRIAFDSALTYKINGIELDIQLTKDKIPVVFHDKTLSKMGRPLNRLAGISLSDFKKLQFEKYGLCNDQGVLTLEEVLSLYTKKTFLFLEIKIRGGLKKAFRRHFYLLDKIIEMLHKKQLSQKVNLLCFYPEILEIARLKSPDIKRIQNIRDISNWEHASAFVDNMDGVCVKLDFLDTSFVKEIHSKGKPVFVYTCDTPKDVELAIQCGVDGIMTNDPKWLVSFLKF